MERYILGKERTDGEGLPLYSGCPGSFDLRDQYNEAMGLIDDKLGQALTDSAGAAALAAQAAADASKALALAGQGGSGQPSGDGCTCDLTTVNARLATLESGLASLTGRVGALEAGGTGGSGGTGYNDTELRNRVSSLETRVSRLESSQGTGTGGGSYDDSAIKSRLTSLETLTSRWLPNGATFTGQAKVSDLSFTGGHWTVEGGTSDNPFTVKLTDRINSDGAVYGIRNRKNTPVLSSAAFGIELTLNTTYAVRLTELWFDIERGSASESSYIALTGFKSLEDYPGTIFPGMFSACRLTATSGLFTDQNGSSPWMGGIGSIFDAGITQSPATWRFKLGPRTSDGWAIWAKGEVGTKITIDLNAIMAIM